MLHLIRLRTKLKLQSYVTFASCPVPNTAHGTRAKRTPLVKTKRKYGMILKRSDLEMRVQKF